jgi:hypothetical protein
MVAAAFSLAVRFAYAASKPLKRIIFAFPSIRHLFD